jgi:two-component sensor histidine kinase
MKPGETVHFTTGEQEVTVDTDTAVPIGLILNELFTNAFKYALQPNRENTLRLQIRETVTGGREMYEMTFADNGTGMPEGFSIEHSGSLGMKVIQLLTRQLGGTLRYYNKDGAVFEICFPKANDKPAAL